MRSISHVVAMSINTVSGLLHAAGAAFEEFHDEAVRNVRSKRVQCDKSRRCTPAMAACVTDRLWSLDNIIALIDARAAAAKCPNIFKKRNSNCDTAKLFDSLQRR